MIARQSKNILLFLFVFMFAGSTTFATIGVGVGTGKIDIDEPIKTGGIYELPPISVYNTGDETATYSMQLTLNETQQQHKPDPAWFTFSPASFVLEPDKAQLVTPTLRAPITAQTGEYFGYLEANPDTTVDQNGTAIGVAAATKLSFTLVSSNIFVSLWTRAYALFLAYSPWTYLVLAFIALSLLLYILRRFLRIDIRVTKTRNSKKEETEKNSEE